MYANVKLNIVFEQQQMHTNPSSHNRVAYSIYTECGLGVRHLFWKQEKTLWTNQRIFMNTILLETVPPLQQNIYKIL